ncbi:helix-turn-helix transcriptional regulator [Acaricomes phytoseiuli]|uniref:helix-turn-helix transcriptional regulator n=3 Tax=Acaricomes phytoseiuli TaxID=291968 RepID=UPI00037EE9BD|nr:winged helix-turn-helix transcriptional regulator [Acaricomes phytoseiuli]
MRASDQDEKTRDRVRDAVLEHGPVNAARLGRLLGLTPAAVRRHLDRLEQDGVIEVKLLRGPGQGAGRPSRHYVLSSQGQSGIGNDYLQIARAALEQLAAVHGREAIKVFAEQRFAAMEKQYQPLLEAAGDDIAARAQILSDALSAEGYVSSAQRLDIVAASNSTSNSNSAHAAGTAAGSTEAGQAVQLCQGHCPVLELAAEYNEFCEAETTVFARLLGVDIRRLSTLAGGGHVCTTHIPIGRLSNQLSAEQLIAQSGGEREDVPVHAVPSDDENEAKAEEAET